MFLPILPGLSFSSQEPDSWWNRIRENLSNVIAPAHASPSSANGAPIHLLNIDKKARAGRAQTISAVTHAGLVATLVLVAFRSPGGLSFGTSPLLQRPVLTLDRSIFAALGAHPSNGSGSGGDHNPIPATRGNPPPASSIQLLPPSIRQNPNAELPVPPTLLDSNAPPVLISIDRIGLPWMPAETNSGGPGNGRTIGSGDGNTMGDSGNGQAGFGESSEPYRAGMIMPTCLYCPLPAYSDEARKVKMQGTVTMRVLVGTDGRASDVRVVRGVGFGLDERAMEAVRGWKFSPSRDAGHHPIQVWIIVETVFRLF